MLIITKSQNRGCSTLTCIGLFSMCAANMPDLFCPLFYFPILKWGLVGFYDFCCNPMEEEVS